MHGSSLGWNNIQLMPLSEDDMTICSPEAGILPEGEQIVKLSSLKGINSPIIPIPSHFSSP